MKKITLLFTIACISQLYGMEPIDPISPMPYEAPGEVWVEELPPTLKLRRTGRRTGPQKGDLGSFEQLPKELRQEIATTALATSTTVNEAIKAIQNASAVYGGVKLDSAAAMDLLVKTLPNDLDKAISAVKNLQGTTLQDFTKLVHTLADKFNITTYQVAKMYRTYIGKMYSDHGKALLNYVRMVVNNLAEYDDIIALINDGADVNFSVHTKDLTPLSLAINNQFNVEVIKTLLDAGAKPTNQNLKEFNSLAAWHPDDKVRKSAIKQLLEEAIKK